MRWPTTISIALWTAGLALLAFAMRLALRKRISGNRRALLRICCVAIIGLPGLLSIGAGGILFWFHHRSQPSPEQRTLFNGIQYERDVRRLPRPMVIHIVTIDLHAKGVGFLVTPESPVEGRKLKARTATEFLEEFHVQIAIDANYFWPFWVHNPLHFYPQRGDPVNPSGLVASQGNTYSNQEWADGMVYLSVNNEASFDRPAGPVYNAINGNGRFLRDGLFESPVTDDAPTVYARAALALDRGGRHMILVAIDGKQPGYSEGATLAELAEIIQSHGGIDATRLDEGGSVILVMADANGHAKQLNSPIHTRIPGRERPSAVHLGVFARLVRK